LLVVGLILAIYVKTVNIIIIDRFIPSEM